MVQGAEASIAKLKAEAGGHRWQRIPPTERNGRVHTSTVTVAVLPLLQTASKLRMSDVMITTTRSGGKGGQNVNKTESAVVVVHIPTKTTVRIENERDQHANKRIALEILEARILDQQEQEQLTSRNNDRRHQIGSGQRGDKIRTYRVKDSIVNDHVLGKKFQLERVLEGRLP